MADNRWLVVRIKSPSAQQAALLAEGLFAFGAEALHEKPDEVVTWLTPPADVDAYLATLRSGLSELLGVNDLEIGWEWQPERDWSEEWKKGLGPRRVGNHFIIAPTWTTPETRPADVVITIDPQMAFGTGEHGTTRGMLRLLEHNIAPGDRVLDVGTGSAVLAIAAARLGAREVRAVEVHEDSLINARENVERNAVAGAVTLECALVDDAFLTRAGQFDVILANILSSVIIPLLPPFRRALPADGRLIVSGILQSEAAGVVAAARAQGLSVVQEDREDEWWSAVLRLQ